MKIYVFFLSGVIGVFQVINAQAAGDANEGKVKFYACGGCHSIPGYSNVFPTYPVPRIGRQHKEVISAALQDYKSGARKHGSMEGNANGLSDQDIEDIASFLEGQRLESTNGPIVGDVSAGRAKAESCGGCHGADGNSVSPAIPTLAGQYEGYLVKALKDYQAGKRNNPIMNGMSTPLSETDIIDISAFYANQSKGLVTVRD